MKYTFGEGRECIDKFDGDYRWLSNFWTAPVEFQGLVYPTSEHAFQAMKTQDYDTRRLFVICKTPGDAKCLGKKITLRSDWFEVRVMYMYLVVKLKFSQNFELGEKLLATGDTVLIEGNRWNDAFWGVCEGEGSNMLGHVLMAVRSELRYSRRYY